MATHKENLGKGENSPPKSGTGNGLEIPIPVRAPYDPFGSIKRRVRPQEMPVSRESIETPPARMAPVAANDAGRLVVGEGVSIKGEIHSCESLVVWGTVDSEIEAASLDIFEPGVVRGDAKVGTAEILGTFEGALVVKGRLRIRATGKASGSIRYGELHIEPGGVISGEVQSATPETVSVPRATPMSEPAVAERPKAAGAA